MLKFDAISKDRLSTNIRDCFKAFILVFFADPLNVCWTERFVLHPKCPCLNYPITVRISEHQYQLLPATDNMIVHVHVKPRFDL